MRIGPLLLHSSLAAVNPEHRRVLHLEYSLIDLLGGLKWFEEHPSRRSKKTGWPHGLQTNLVSAVRDDFHDLSFSWRTTILIVRWRSLAAIIFERLGMRYKVILNESEEGFSVSST